MHFWPAAANAPSQASADRARGVRVGEHDQRVVAAELALEAHLALGLLHASREHPPDGGRAGERERAQVRIVGEREADLGAAEHDLQRLLRHTRLVQDLDQRQHRAGRGGGRLDHDGVARRERRRELPRGDRDREVPRRDQPHDAQRAPAREGERLRLRRVGELAAEALGLAGVEVQHGRRALDLAGRVGEQLALLGDDPPRQLPTAPPEEIGGAVQQLPTARSGQTAPASLSSVCARAGLGHVAHAVGLVGRDHLARVGGVAADDRRRAHARVSPRAETAGGRLRGAPARGTRRMAPGERGPRRAPLMTPAPRPGRPAWAGPSARR